MQDLLCRCYVARFFVKTTFSEVFGLTYLFGTTEALINVPKQRSQAPLFANLASVVARSDLPAGLKQVVLDVLAQQTPLGPQLDAEDIASAFQKSGLFLEASLASGLAPASGNVPDLKAALLVLRQTLAATSGALETTASRVAAPASALGAAPAAPLQAGTSPEQIGDEALQAKPLSPEAGQGQALQAPHGSNIAAAALAEAVTEGVPPRAMSPGVALSLLQQAVQELPHAMGAAFTAPKAAVPDAHSLDRRRSRQPRSPQMRR
jgi:hypothetical protein